MRFTLLCLWMLTVSLSSYADDTHLQNSLQKVVDEAIADSGFNGGIVVARQNQTVLQAFSGFADENEEVKLGKEHQFSPGSVGKEFTTISIMQLVEQGKINYQDRIATYINGLPSWSEQVTVENLMDHTSGLPRIKWKKGITTADVVHQIKQATLAFEPGRDYLYSNINVVLRALIVETVSNMTFQDYLNKAIFQIAGMTNSYQQVNVDGTSPMLVSGDYPTAIKGVTIYVTPLDLLRFEQALHSGKLLPLQAIYNSVSGDSVSGKPNRARFDFGLYLHDQNGKLTYWEHDGSNPSHHTLKFHDFEQDITVVMMSSDGNKSTLFGIKERIVDYLKAKSG
ncbi:MAG: serine hydrolase domain-containing protein [Aestuariibacter sp.]